jgi:TRAP-type C4-dicarboxylate transport system substrate-binding protein
MTAGLTACALTTALAGGLAGCSASSGAAAGKAGAPPDVLRVVMADSQPADAPTGIAMQEFAAHVDDLSRGAIKVETRSAGEFADNAGDAKVITALRSGAVQLATVPARAWSDIGVNSTDVLQAPFEVQSNTHMAAVAADTSLAERALSGLDGKGVHGLGLLPERLRILVGFGAPLTQPSDLNGKSLRSLSSSVGKAATALGATWVNPTDDAFAAMRTSGELRATETDWQRAQGLAAGAFASADLVLYAKFVSIGANADWWSGLTAAQRRVLTDAAAATREDASSALGETADDAATFCNAGGVVVHVGTAAQAQFRSALADLTAAVDQTALQQLRADQPQDADPVPATCGPAQGGLDPSHVVPAAGDLPPGVYRYQWTEAFARQWNAKGAGIQFEGHDAPGLFDTFTITWTLKGGHYTFEILRDGKDPLTTTGVYQVKGHQMLLELGPDIGNVVNQLRWTVNSDGSLTMRQVDGLPSDPYYGLRWKRIGDA